MVPLRPSIRSRLLLVAALSAVLALLPAAQVGWRAAEDRAFTASELSALPANRGWQAVIAAVQKHREAAAQALVRPEAAAARDAAAAAARERLAALPPLLAQARVGEPRRESVAKLAERFDSLARTSAAGGDATALLDGHRRLLADMMDEVAEVNADAQLLLDPEAAAYFAIIAGLQLAPKVSDALSELAAIGHAVRVDDTALLASARTRFEESSRAMRLHLAQAARLDPAMRAGFGETMRRADQQAALVGKLLAEVVQDVNYPLDRFSAALTEAQSLQAATSAEVIDRIEGALTDRMNRQTRLSALLGTLIVIGLAVTGAILWRTLGSVLASVRQAVQVTERIAGGDLSRPVPTGRGDELSRVLAALSVMQDRLRDLLQRLQDSAGSIHVGSSEVARGSQDLSQRTEQTATRLQEASATASRVDSALRESAQVAAEADGRAGEAARVAREGGGVVAEVVSAMADIHSRSQRIAEITGVIDGIAFQTNILALNAAVEAARAGDHGRGFAVVAAEVRQLAQRSAQAAREIKALIASTAERIEDGSSRARHAGAAMHEIVGSIEAVNATMKRLATEVASHVQDMTVVSEAVAGVEALTQQNAALVEQSAASAESMDREATRMRDLARVFSL